MDRVQGLEEMEEFAQRQAEFPERGTSLNPMAELWWAASTPSYTNGE